MHKYFLGLLSGALYLVRNTTYNFCESTPGLHVRDIPNEFANGDALTHILVRPEPFGAPEPDNILREKSAPLPLHCHFF